jgi:hypothetical protein
MRSWSRPASSSGAPAVRAGRCDAARWDTADGVGVALRVPVLAAVPVVPVVPAVLAALVGLLPGCTECATDADCPAVADGVAGARCLDGACIDPQPADAAAAACTDDAACAAGERCIDGGCAIVPTCLRLDATFDAVFVPAAPDAAPTVGALTATTTACAIRFATTMGGGVPATMAAAGVADDETWLDPVGFDGGSWNRVSLVGEIVVPGGAGTLRFGTRDFACIDDDACGDQLSGTCRAPCDGGCVGDCVDGLCAPASRGVCQ